MEEARAKPFDDWVLYITNHFTHLVVESQAASPRYHLARKLSEKGQKLLVYCPIGRHVGSPLRDFVTNLRPKKVVNGNSVYLFPPVIVSPASATTPLTLIMGTFFIMAYLALTRIRVSAQYSTTILVASVGAVLRRRMKLPLVVNYGDPDFARERGLSLKAFRFCENLVMSPRSAFAVVCVDEVIEKYVRKVFGVRRTLFLPNGGYEEGATRRSPESQVGPLRNKLGLDGKLVIMYAGQLTSVYRLDLLIGSAPDVIRAFPQVRYLIIGSGPTALQLANSVKSADLTEYFSFLGSIAYDKLDPYLALSDVCVQLLNDWCMGTKVIMYMVHENPVVATGAWFDQYSVFLKNGENIVMLPPDSKMLSAALVELLQNKDERRRIGEAGWSSARPYTWERHADETLKLLRQAASDA